MDFEYVTPIYHQELFEIIVDFHPRTLINFAGDIKASLASSIRSNRCFVDTVQIDKTLTMLKRW